jgi:hypothetical protein
MTTVWYNFAVVELPSVKNRRWHFRLWAQDIVEGVLALGLGVFEILLFRDPAVGIWPVFGAFVCTTLFFASSIIRALRKRSDEAKFEPIEQPKELIGWAKSLHAELCKQIGKPPSEAGLRIVVHKVHWDKRRTFPTELEQITEYVGDFGGPIGRKRISARSGIIGRAARLSRPYVAARVSSDDNDFRDELVDTWGFNKDEAHDRAADRWAWFALPLLQPDDFTAHGVVYLDAKSVNFFDDESVRNAILSNCNAIASICASV